MQVALPGVLADCECTAKWQWSALLSDLHLPSTRPSGTVMAAFRASARGGRKAGKFELTEEQRQEIREAFDLFDTGEHVDLLVPPHKEPHCAMDTFAVVFEPSCERV